ncbi:Protein pih1d3 [Boothiomyces sp. JEL0866]|nr:Protein pih1d3 [Boothiomyces sp. JEL0866]
MNFASDEIGALSSLLAPNQETHQIKSDFTPGAIGPKKKHAVVPKPKNEADIWDEDEVDLPVEAFDPREEPEYELKYVQKVSSEDMYLGMSGRTPSIGHSDNLSITVKLPDAQFKDISISITKSVLEVMTPAKKLKLFFPRPVQDEKGTAKWESDTCTLKINVPLEPPMF